MPKPLSHSLKQDLNYGVQRWEVVDFAFLRAAGFLLHLSTSPSLILSVGRELNVTPFLSFCLLDRLTFNLQTNI